MPTLTEVVKDPARRKRVDLGTAAAVSVAEAEDAAC
jgi:hypothetical protein